MMPPPQLRSAKQALNPNDASVSIYSLRPRSTQRYILFLVAAIGSLTPVTDTIILPALISVEQLPGSTRDTSAAIISAYMGAVGVFTLFWGPLSDRLGRRLPLLVSAVLYLAVTIACIFAPSAAALLALRAAQGAVTGATATVSQVRGRACTRRPLHATYLWPGSRRGRLCPPRAQQGLRRLLPAVSHRPNHRQVVVAPGSLMYWP